MILPNPQLVTLQDEVGSSSPINDKKIDIASYHQQLHTKLATLSPEKLSQLLEELLPRELWHTRWDDVKPLLGYSQKHDCLSVVLGNKPHALVLRRSVDGIKWKTYGEKTYTPHHIFFKDDIVYIASGIGEYLALKLFGVSFITPQSDSTVHAISQGMMNASKGFIVVYLQDNDPSGKKLATVLEEKFRDYYFVVVDFEKLLGKSLPKGYDFRDYIVQYYKLLGFEGIKSTLEGYVYTLLGENYEF